MPSPTDLPSLYGWYKGETGLYDATSGGSAVTSDLAYIRRWEDQSGNARHLTQNSDSNRPVYDAAKGLVSFEGYNGGGGNDNQYINTPASFDLDKRACSVIVIGELTSLRRPMNGSGLGTFHFVNKVTSDVMNFHYNGDASGTTMGYLANYDGGFRVSTVRPFTNRMCVFGFVPNSSNVKCWRESSSNTVQVMSAGTATVTSFFGYSVANGLQANIKDLIVCSTNISDSDWTNTVLPYAYTRGVAANRLHQLVFMGDSLTCGYGQRANRCWPTLLSRINSCVRFSSTAESGALLSTLNSRYSANEAGMYVASETNVLCIFAGTNDISNAGQTGTAVYNTLVSLTSAARTTGYKVIWFTMLDRNFTATNEGYRNTFNSNVRSNWSTEADGLVDVDADPRLDDSADSTYFLSDQTHLTSAGAAVVAELAEPVIGQFLPGVAPMPLNRRGRGNRFLAF